MTADIPNGIYFGIPEDQYHAIPRLSATGCKTICASPLEYWLKSWMNPNRKPDTDTPAKKLGRSYHKLLLEGDAAFEAAYAVAPSKEDHPGAIDTADDLRAECERLGLKKSGTKAEMCDRLHEADPTLVLWPDIMDDFQVLAEGKEILTKAQWEEIQQVRYVLNHMPEIRSAFTGGFAEVAVLWTEYGVPMKAKFDYLKALRKMAAILDLKTFANVLSKPVEVVPATEISRNNYFIQPIVYTSARAAAAEMWAAKGMDIVTTIDGPEPSYSWLQSVMTPKHCSFQFVFARTGGIPDVICREFSRHATFNGKTIAQTRDYWKKGSALFQTALGRYAKYMEKYGPDAPWITEYGIGTLRDEDFPVWALDYADDFEADEAA